MSSPFLLITEDDADDRFLIQAAFAEKKHPFQIEFVENGAELLNYLNDLKGNEGLGLRDLKLILLDLNMPKKDGREALKEIKDNADFKNVPVIIFTTTHNEQEIARCKKFGADGYVVKPVTFEGLLTVIDDVIDFCSGSPDKKMSQVSIA